MDKENKIKNYLHIKKKLTMQTNPIEERIQFWDSFLKKYEEKAIDGVVRGVKETHEEL